MLWEFGRELQVEIAKQEQTHDKMAGKPAATD